MMIEPQRPKIRSLLELDNKRLALAQRLVDIGSNIFSKRRRLHDYQEEFALEVAYNAICRNPVELSALFARQTGKTETIGRIVAILVLFLPILSKAHPDIVDFPDGFWCGIFAPVKDQAKTTYERIKEVMRSKRYKALMAKNGVKYEKKTADRIILTNGSMVVVKSASPGSQIEGETLHLALCEESQDIAHIKVRKSIEPMTAATMGMMVHVGTANTLRSPFYETIQKNKRMELKGETKRKRHFQFDWKTVVKRSINYAKYLNQKLQENGQSWLHTDIFKMAFGCEFILERGQFVSVDRFLALEKLCENISRATYNAISGMYEGYRSCYAGIDWGKSQDSTVVTIVEKHLDHVRILDWLQLQGDDYASQIDSITAFLGRFKSQLKIVLAESNGVGDPMVDFLKKACREKEIHAQVEGFWTSASSKSAGYTQFGLALVSNNNFLFPADAAAQKSLEYAWWQDQLTMLQKEYKGSLLKCSHPDQEDAHDDYPDSAMMAFVASSLRTTDDLLTEFYGAAA